MGELPFQSVDPFQVRVDVMVAAALVRQEPESSPGVMLPRSGSAEMDDGGKILLVLKRRSCGTPVADGAGDVPVEQRRGHLDGMAGDDA